MSQVQGSTQPTSRISNPTIAGAALLATAFAALVIVGAFVAFSAARTPAIGTSAAAIQAVDGWEKAVVQGHMRRAQALQDGWELRLAAAQANRIQRAQALQDGWEIALYR
jgi:hypothetical protein